MPDPDAEPDAEVAGRSAPVAADAPPLRAQNEGPQDGRSTALLRPKQQTAFGGRRHPRGHAVRWWREILSLAGSVASSIVMVVILARAHNTSPPPKPLNLNLNAFVALASSVARLAFLFPVSQGLSQQKWLWFQSPQRLSDFQMFNAASDGFFGSLTLLVRLELRKRGFTARLGAIIMISSLLTSTFTQNIIDPRERLATSKNETAVLPTAESFSLWNGTHVDPAPFDTNLMRQALLDGISANPANPLPYIQAVCPSGECRWPDFGTLAICSDVFNLTAQGNQTLLAELRKTTATRLDDLYRSAQSMFRLEIGVELIPPSFPLILGPLPYPTGHFNKSVEELLIMDSFIAYSDTKFSRPENGTFRDADLSSLRFLELGLFLCTKTLSSEVRGGISYTREVSSQARARKSVDTKLNYKWTMKFFTCYVTNTCPEVLGATELELEPPPGAPGTGEYVVHLWSALMSSALLFVTMFDAGLTDQGRGFLASNGGGASAGLAPSLFGDLLATELPTPDEQLLGVRNVSRNIAQSLSNLARKADSRLHRTPNATTVLGDVLRPQSYVFVRWEYISLLATQLLLDGVFLIGTIVATQNAGLPYFGDSSLPPLWALGSRTRQELAQGIGDPDELGRRAGLEYVQLSRAEEGLVLAREADVLELKA